jgi:hypothetical protein
MKRLPHIPKSGRSKTVLSLAICLCFGTAAVTSGFGQNEPKPTSIEEKTKIHRLATTKRAGKAEKIDEAYGKIRLNKGDLHQLMAFLNLLNDGNTPFSFDVTKAVTEGENTVRLKGIGDWAMNPQNKTPNTPPMPSFYFAGQKNLMIIARQILGNLLTQLPSPLKYLIQRAGGNAVSLGHRLFY